MNVKGIINLIDEYIKNIFNREKLDEINRQYLTIINNLNNEELKQLSVEIDIKRVMKIEEELNSLNKRKEALQNINQKIKYLECINLIQSKQTIKYYYEQFIKEINYKTEKKLKRGKNGIKRRYIHRQL